MTSEERRAKPRFDVCQFVDVSFMREEFIHVEGINLSEEGLLVKGDKAVEPYTKIFFMINLEDGAEAIKGEGLSMRCEFSEGYFYIGVKILELKHKDRLRLRAFLEKLGSCHEVP